jgi:DNA-binding CsgD family transcriptional regulator
MDEAIIVYIEPLTSREQEVLDELGKGSSNEEISVSLFMANRTVRSHLIHIFDKLGVKTRLEAILTAQKLGLVDTAPSISPEARVILVLDKLNPAAIKELISLGLLDLR